MACANKRIECDICPRKFRSKLAIERHMDPIHPDDRFETFVSVPQNVEETNITVEVQDCGDDQSTAELQVEIHLPDSNVYVELPDRAEGELSWEKEQDVILLQLRDL